jgi:DNA polymerase-3 subunit gamma/tau
LIDYWRDLMLVSLAGPKSTGLNCSATQADVIAGQAAAMTLDTILAGLDVLQTTKFRLRGSAHGRVLLEMALVRLSRLEDLAPLTQLVEALRGDAPDLNLSVGKSAPASGSPARSIAPPEALKKKPDEPGESAARATRPLTAENLAESWPEVLAQLGRIMASELENAGLPAISGPNTLVLTFDPVYNRQCDYCSDPGRLERVCEALRRQTGSEWKIRIESGTNTGHGTVVAPIRKENPDNGLRQSLFQHVESVLNAKLVKIDDGFGAQPEPADESTSVTEEP